VCPSGQRERAVNPSAQPTEVRILPPPPKLPYSNQRDPTGAALPGRPRGRLLRSTRPPKQPTRSPLSRRHWRPRELPLTRSQGPRLTTQENVERTSQFSMDLSVVVNKESPKQSLIYAPSNGVRRASVGNLGTRRKRDSVIKVGRNQGVVTLRCENPIRLRRSVDLPTPVGPRTCR
jgi:hypothetical protein